MYFIFLPFLRGRIRRRGQKLCEHFFNDDDSNRTVLQRVTHVQFAWRSAAHGASPPCCMQILDFSAVLDFSFLCEAPLYFSWTVLRKRDVTLLSVVGFAVAIGIITLFFSFGKMDPFFCRGAWSSENVPNVIVKWWFVPFLDVSHRTGWFYPVYFMEVRTHLRILLRVFRRLSQWVGSPPPAQVVRRWGSSCGRWCFVSSLARSRLNICTLVLVLLRKENLVRGFQASLWFLKNSCDGGDFGGKHDAPGGGPQRSSFLRSFLFVIVFSCIFCLSVWFS